MIFALMEVGLVAEVAGWHVITSHSVSTWEQWQVQGGQGYPAFPDGPTVNHVFPTRADYLRELDRANDAGTFNPRIPTPIPTIITMRQTRLMLLSMGLLQIVENALQQLPEPNRSYVLVEWNHGSQVERYNPFVTELVGMLGMTPDQTDQFFVNASTF